MDSSQILTMKNLRQQELLDLSKCPHCRVASPLMQRIHTFYFKGMVATETKDWTLYMCRSCGQPTMAGGTHGTGGTVDTLIPQPREIDDQIPERPRTYLQQAMDTIHSPAASVMVSASAIDSMLKTKGLVKGSLYTRIDEAATQHLITREMAAWAHDIRLDANDERHADTEAVTSTSDDAHRCLAFAIALAEYLFVLPARVERGRGGNSA